MLSVTANPELSARTTLRLGGIAIAEIVARSVADLEALPETARRLGGTVRVLGRGSNILARDGQLPIVLLRPDFPGEPEVLSKKPDHALICVGTGIGLPRLLGRLAEWGLSGLEGLAGIPGTVGGALAMNAGSYGVEFCAKLHSARVFSPEKGLLDIPAGEIRFDYRAFNIPGVTDGAWFVATHCTLQLERRDPGRCTRALRETFSKKKASQPISARSAGCVFKNPTGYLPAGKLLDLAGVKGMSAGALIFSGMHANFLINGASSGKSGGTAEQALLLMELAARAVRATFGIGLVPEILIW